MSTPSAARSGGSVAMAVSLPGMAMVGRAFGWRTTWATAGVVVVGGLLAGGLLVALG